MARRTLTYNGREYPEIEVQFRDFGNVLVSVESLQHELMDGLDFKDDGAEAIDGRIFYYVPDEVADGEDADILSFMEKNFV